MRVNLAVNGRPREADDVWEGESLLHLLREVTVEGLAAYAEQRVAHGGRDTGTVVGENGDGDDNEDEEESGSGSQGGAGVGAGGRWLAADELLERVGEPSDADVREALSGNLCRCTGYEKILDAVRLAAARREHEGLQEEAV